MTESEKIPAVFIHKGFPNYLKITVACAKEYQNRVIVLGDKENKKIQTDEWYLMTDYRSLYFASFQKAYIHRSENSVWFEIICFERYFVLLEFMKREKMKECFMIDSDVLLYDNVNNLACNDFDAGGGNEKTFVNPCILYWTVSALEDFVLFCLAQYQDQKKWQALEQKYLHLKKSEPYSNINICDMFLLKLWADSTTYKWKNFFAENTDHLIDGNINNPKCADTNEKEYKIMRDRLIKKYTFKDGLPFLIDNQNNKTQVFAIHCQGTAKKYIDSLYKRIPPHLS